MSDEILERLRAVAIVIMLAAIAHAIGCKTVAVAPYNDTVTQIDQVIADLKASKDTDTVTIRKRQIDTLEKARTNIVSLSAKTETETEWTGAAKGAAAAGGVVIIVAAVVLFLRRK